MKQTLKKISNILAFVSGLALPFIVSAQSDVNSGLSKLSPLFPSNNTNATVSDLIITVIRWLLGLAAGVAILFIIIGGYWYITSAGNEDQAEKGKSTLVNAIIGIVLIVLSYVIVTAVANTVGSCQGILNCLLGY